MAKGSQFERDFSRSLSLWWTGGERDDVFWRSQNSGGRATVRSRVGKKTSGQYGDIAATDKLGEPLLRIFTFELKRGYNAASAGNDFDSVTGKKATLFTQFVMQAENAAKRAGSLYWALLTRRDRRGEIVTVPTASLKTTFRFAKTNYENLMRISGKLTGRDGYIDMTSMSLDNFFAYCDPSKIRELAECL